MKKLYPFVSKILFVFLITISFAAKADITINVKDPKSGQTYSNDLFFTVYVTSTYALKSVEASIGGRTVQLEYSSMYGYYYGRVSVRGLPQGTSMVNFLVKDVLANTQTASVTFNLDNSPMIYLQSPTPDAAWQSKLHVKASVADEGSTNCAGSLTFAGISGLDIPFVNSIDTLIDPVPGKVWGAVSPVITARDSTGHGTSATVNTYRDNSSPLKPLYTDSGRIVDFTDNHLLTIREGDNKVKYCNIINLQDSTVDSVRLSSEFFTDDNFISRLTKNGAAFLVYIRGSNSYAIYLWANDSLSNITQSLGVQPISQYLQTVGNNLVWVTADGKLATTNVTTSHTVFTGSNVERIGLPIHSDGDNIVYTVSTSLNVNEVYKYNVNTNMSTQITHDASKQIRHLSAYIDGNMIAYTKQRVTDGGPGTNDIDTTYLYDGTMEINLGPRGTQPILKNGYMLFNRSDSSQSFTWVRFPSGTLQQLTYFNYGTIPDAIDMNGRALIQYTTNGRLYWDSLTPLQPACGIFGTTYTIDSTFYLALGGTLFTMDIPSALKPPVLTGFSPDSAAQGDTITIRGKNLIGVSAVSFGGVPATSFSMKSDSVLTAVTSTGASGNVLVTTSGGTASLAGFTYILPPKITAISPTTGTTGTTVLIAGANFADVTAVSFGDSIATSFTVNSTGSISAIVGAGASGKVSVVTKKGGKATIDGFNFVFTLPADNFKLTNTAATCRGTANGSVKISAAKSMNYTATIASSGQPVVYPFTSDVEIKNLAAGSYNICLKVANQPAYQQCYTVVITEPKDLSVYMKVNKSPREAIVSLSGGEHYQVEFNGVIINTDKNELILPLTDGVNTLAVSTDKPCQGRITKEIMVDGKLSVFPNPFLHSITINLGTDDIKRTMISVYNTVGKLVLSRSYQHQAGNLSIDLSDLSSGFYLLKVSADQNEKTFKILKK